MEIVKSNMINLEPFQLWYCGMIGTSPIYAPMTVIGLPSVDMFTFYMSANPGAPYFTISKSNQKWLASTFMT